MKEFFKNNFARVFYDESTDALYLEYTNKVPNDEQFILVNQAVLDAFVGYRLPNRRGLLSLAADNVLDESFQFQDVDASNPSLFPERVISFRFTLAFE